MATFGIALLLAGYLRYTLQGGEMQRFSQILLIAGGVLFLAALGFGYREVIAYFSRRQSKLGANSLTLIVSVLAILVLINVLGFRHHKRFDLTTEKLYSLSDQTKTIVSGLKQDVDIFLFTQRADVDLKDTMTEFTNLSPHLHYKQVDPEKNPEIAHQYGVTKMGQAVASSGTNHVNLEGTTEQDLTNGIVKVTRNAVKSVCFVEGHGERSITGRDQDGFSAAGDALKKDSYQTQSINLATGGSVPSDCSVVVIPGPKQAFFPAEAQLLTKYLDDGGKVFLMVDPEKDPKLDDLLAAWNIKLGDNWVIDASALSQLARTGPIVPIVVNYSTSPITRHFNQTTMTFYPEARTVSIADKGKTQPDDTELMKTSERSFTIPKLDPKQHEIKFDAKTDTLGPLSLGVAAQRKSGGDSGAKGGRLVVIGNSQFAANNAFGQVSNGDLFSNAVNWLAEDEGLISIRPKSPTNRRVNLTETQDRELSWFSLLLLPGIVILSGAYVWWKRR
jgi:ABC-type uncharacterized transport system involved in gliding motility auxiliary subunit